MIHDFFSLKQMLVKKISAKEDKFERGAAHVGPGIGLDFPFPLLQCTHINEGGYKLGLQKQLTFKQLKSFLERLDKKEA